MNYKKQLTAIPPRFFCLLLYAILTGCGTERVHATFKVFDPVELSEKLSDSSSTGKIDNFIVIMDTSSTMNNRYLYEVFDSDTIPTLFEVEKEVLERLNQTIPAMKLNVAIRTFGFGPCQSWRFSLERLALGIYDKKSFTEALNSIECAGGGSPLDFAIEQVGVDLESATGNAGVLIIGDGNYDDDAVVALIELKKLYGDRICVHTISLTQNPSNRLAMRRLAGFSRCGYTTTAEEIAIPSGMAEFVEKSFFRLTRSDRRH